MKRNLLLVITVIYLIWLGACTTQGRLTYQTFENSDNYTELHESMEELKKAGYNGSIQQQVSAVKALRYISKYMTEEQGKQEMAVHSLIFLAFGSTDGDIQARSKSRINTILENPTWDLSMKWAVIEGIGDFIQGHLGYQESFNEVTYNLPLEYSERKDATEYLLEKNGNSVSFFAIPSYPDCRKRTLACAYLSKLPRGYLR